MVSKCHFPQFPSNPNIHAISRARSIPGTASNQQGLLLGYVLSFQKCFRCDDGIPVLCVQAGQCHCDLLGTLLLLVGRVFCVTPGIDIIGPTPDATPGAMGQISSSKVGYDTQPGTIELFQSSFAAQTNAKNSVLLFKRELMI